MKPKSILDNNPQIKEDVREVQIKSLEAEVNYLKQVIAYNLNQYAISMKSMEDEMQNLYEQLEEARSELIIKNKAISF